MLATIEAYNESLNSPYKEICIKLECIIAENLLCTENKIWHAHPVWFINENPIVGYSLQKKGIRLMFWSGASFNEPLLNVVGGKFKDASIFYNNVSEIKKTHLKNWLKKAVAIQWDYKNIIKRKGVLIPLTNDTY